MDSPGKRRPRLNYGQALANAGRHQESLAALRSVWSLPDDGSVAFFDVYREMGTAYSHLGLREEAIQYWKRALESVPTDPRVLTNLAVALKQKGEHAQAMLYAASALHSGYELPETLAVLGDISMERGDFQSAVRYLKRYLYFRPEDARVFWSLAIALRETGDLHEALRSSRRFRELEHDAHYQRIADQLTEQIRTMIAGTTP